MTNAELLTKIRAEIKRRINWKGKIQTPYYMGCSDELKELLSFLDTLEEKSEKPMNLDLEKEIDKYLPEMMVKNPSMND